jgi:hypothetical protein
MTLSVGNITFAIPRRVAVVFPLGTGSMLAERAQRNAPRARGGSVGEALMKVAILAGGLGAVSRETEPSPPMVEIGDEPILWHIMRHYSTTASTTS